MGLRLGRYETTERLAAGGMATVYLGRAVGEGGFERVVAIKVMHEHVAAEAEFRAMFLDEARLAARIRHPNVVGVLDIQKTPEGALFLVMDFIDGPSLFQLRKALGAQKERLPLDVTLRIFLDTLAGLHAAHELTNPEGAPLQLVHRDISPQNILVGKDGITRITDFGVARAEERITSTRGGQLKGKIAYMPPEQVRNEDIDRRADVYAAGVALWEALTDRRLFDGGSDAALVHMIVGGATQSPRDVDPTIPAAISDVCMRALALNREQRPATAAELADAIEAAAREAGIAIASQRRVAAFVAALPPSKRKAQPGSHPSGPTPSLREPPAASPPVDPPVDRNRATIPEGAERIEPTTTRSLVGDLGPVELPRRSRVPLLVSGLLVLGLGGVGVWRLTSARHDTTSVAAAEQVAPRAPASAPSATATPPPDAPPPSASAPSSAPSAATVASSAPSAEAPLASARVSAELPAGKRPPSPKGRVGVGYNPDNL